MPLTRDEIIAAIAERKKLTEPFPVPEWGGDVHIRLLSAAELKEIGFFSGRDTETLPIRLLVACLSDENGAPLFTKKDLVAVADADFATAIRVFEKAAQVNKLSESDIVQAAEDFGEAQSEADSSD